MKCQVRQAIAALCSLQCFLNSVFSEELLEHSHQHPFFSSLKSGIFRRALYGINFPPTDPKGKHSVISVAGGESKCVCFWNPTCWYSLKGKTANSRDKKSPLTSRETTQAAAMEASSGCSPRNTTLARPGTFIHWSKAYALSFPCLWLAAVPSAENFTQNAGQIFPNPNRFRCTNSLWFCRWDLKHICSKFAGLS